MIWETIASFIACRPKLVDFIIRQAQKTPYFHIEGYMDRWWLVPRFAMGSDEYGNPFPKEWWPLKIRLHHIKREDLGDYPHDHPFDFRSIVLRNWYEEMDLTGRAHMRNAGRTHVHRAEFFHRITLTPSEAFGLCS
jgi:hypothetical protein